MALIVNARFMAISFRKMLLTIERRVRRRR